MVSDLLDTLCSIKIPWKEFHGMFVSIMKIGGHIMIIAVHFDGRLCEECWAEIGKPNLKLIGELIYRRSLGDRLILWTCRSGIQLTQAVFFCKSYGLEFDAVNENLPDIIEKYGNDSRKISADIYIDDRSEKPWVTLLEKAV